MSAEIIRLPMTGPMILAALRGEKTQTRRVVPYKPYSDERISVHAHECRYGPPGQKLALTERWTVLKVGRFEALIAYQADHAQIWREIPDKDARKKVILIEHHGLWLPPMFMQAWAARAGALNVEVRVQPVKEISDEDAEAEGVGVLRMTGWDSADKNFYSLLEFAAFPPIRKFRLLWDSINAKQGHGWDVNPWVWAITFAMAEGD